MSPAGSEYEPQLTTEDDLQAITIEKVIPHNGPITLAEYNPQWPALFAHEAARIRAVLGDAAVRVEHVGSTSVPGLAAKPIIDILLAVPDSADEQAYAPALEAAGYVLRIREPDWFEHRLNSRLRSRCPAALGRHHRHPAAQRSWSRLFAPGDMFLTGTSPASSAQLKVLHHELTALADLPRAFRTADLRLIHAAICCSRYSSWTCCGVRY
jgi:GrpB-like predicted nucleotidyltransferase (UPF0157 family)